MRPYFSLLSVIVGFGDAADAVCCARSLVDAASVCDAAALQRHDIVVVFNGLPDDEIAEYAALLRAVHPSITLLPSPVNLGYAGAASHGIAAYRRDHTHALLLNDDAQMAQGGLQALSRYVREFPQKDLVGMTIVDPVTKAVSSNAGYRYFPLIGYSRPLAVQATQPEMTASRVFAGDYPDGCALLLSRSLLDQLRNQIPCPDFLYYEELELVAALESTDCLGYCADAEVFHQGTHLRRPTRASARRTYLAMRSCLAYTHKHCRRLLPFTMTIRLALTGIRALYRLAPREMAAAASACLDFLRGVPSREAQARQAHEEDPLQ